MNTSTTRVTEQPQATHLEEGKTRLDLLPPLALYAEAEVFTYGAGKYDEYNWLTGILYMRLIASTLRHLLKWVAGIEYDAESGLHHIAHARANLGMLLELIMRGREDLDNRPPAAPAGTNITTRYIA
jgi:hypothetical protein